MSRDIGPVDLRESEAHPFLGREIAQPRTFSESSAQSVDNTVRELLLEAQDRALEIIRAHRSELDRLAVALEEHETLEHNQIGQYLNPSLVQKENIPIATASRDKPPSSQNRGERMFNNRGL